MTRPCESPEPVSVRYRGGCWRVVRTDPDGREHDVYRGHDVTAACRLARRERYPTQHSYPDRSRSMCTAPTTVTYATPERIRGESMRVLTELKSSIDTAGRRCTIQTTEGREDGTCLLLPPGLRSFVDVRWLLRLKGWADVDRRDPADVRRQRYVMVRARESRAGLDAIEIREADGRFLVYPI